jgi:hypothetical protein
MVVSKRARLVVTGATTAVALAGFAIFAGQGASAAAQPTDCAWAAAAARLAVSVSESDDPKAAGIRAQLQKMGFGPDGALPAACADAGSAAPSAGTAAGTAAGSAAATGAGNGSGPLKGKAEKGLFAPTGAGGTTIPVNGGSIEAADPKPGDTVEIASGTYQGFTPKSGSAGAYVTYKAAPGAKVTISGGGGQGVIDLSKVSYVHLDGMTVTDAPSYGIYGSGAKNIALTNMGVDTSQNGGIVILQSSGVHIEGCEITKSNNKGTSADNEALSIGLGTSDFEVFNCKVHDNGEEGIDAKYDTNNGSIHDNLVWGNRGPNIYIDSAQDIDVHGNYVWGAKEESKSGIGLAVENYSQSKKISNITVSGNTIWDNAGGGVGCWVESSGSFSGIVVKGNTFAGGNGVKDCGMGGVSAADNVTGAIPKLVDGLVGGVTGLLTGGDSGTSAGTSSGTGAGRNTSRGDSSATSENGSGRGASGSGDAAQGAGSDDEEN